MRVSKYALAAVALLALIAVPALAGMHFGAPPPGPVTILVYDATPDSPYPDGFETGWMYYGPPKTELEIDRDWGSDEWTQENIPGALEGPGDFWIKWTPPPRGSGTIYLRDENGDSAPVAQIFAVTTP